MCGIAGIWDTAGAPVRDGAAAAMQATLTHRGPDAQGMYVQGSCALVHTRLSIIDITHAGAQPFLSADSRYALVFNGEIYNYRELREQYFSSNKFTSDSDTEVLLHMLIRFGTDALPKIRGMFAFAFFDTWEHKMILACDAFGKKPLFYTWTGTTFLFASEPKALIASTYISPGLDAPAIEKYLLHEYCPSPVSGFNGIFTLGAGQYMEIAGDSRVIVRWWKPEIIPKHTMSFQNALSTFDDLLGNAVERRMVADVPVGLFLSGGLDSSTIAWYMRQIKKDGEIHSCSVAFEEKSFNEEHIASEVARSLSLTHHSTVFTKEIFLESLQELLPVLDIPLADASLLPTYIVSKLARHHMKVVLDGDGSDELLGGYGTFQAYEFAGRMQWIPNGAWQLVSRLVDTLVPVSHTYFSSDFKVKSFLRGMAYPSERNLQVWLGAFTEREIEELLMRKPSGTTFGAVDMVVPLNVREPFDRASLYHIHTYLQRDILPKIDRATMAVGLEARTPFLDTDFAEFVLRLPSSFKSNKRILRELMRGRLPDTVLSRKKQGFGIPISAWFSEDLLSFVQEVLSEQKIQHAGIFRYAYIEKLIDEHATKKYDHRKKIWTLIMFQLWYERWLMGEERKVVI